MLFSLQIARKAFSEVVSFAITTRVHEWFGFCDWHVTLMLFLFLNNYEHLANDDVLLSYQPEVLCMY